MKTLIESSNNKTIIEYFSSSDVRSIKISSNITDIEFYSSNKKINLSVRSVSNIDLAIKSIKTTTTVAESKTFVSFISGKTTRIEQAISGPPGPPGPQGPPGPPGPANLSNSIEYKVSIISQLDLENKFLLLDHDVKDPEFTQLVVSNGIEQIPFSDYDIINNKISWDSLALENLLDIGSRVIVRYFRK